MSMTTTTTTTTATNERIGEVDHSQNEPIKQQISTFSDDLSFEERYFDVCISNMGTFEDFTSSYTIHTDHIIGRGAERIVYFGTNRQNEGNVAIHKLSFETKSNLIIYFAKYCIIQKCKFFHQFSAFFTNTDNKLTVILVQELLDKNLTEIILNEPSITMNEAEIKKMTFQLIKQLNELTENHNFLHLDIKPTNIMRRRVTNRHNNDDYNYTLIDFGFAMENESQTNGYLGTAEWSPPEMKPFENSQNVISKSADMWSIGLVILYCLCNGHQPFCFKKRQRLNSLKNIQKWYLKKVVKKQCFIESYLGKLLIRNKISFNLFDFLFKCLRFDPLKRLTPNQAIEHKWFESLRVSEN